MKTKFYSKSIIFGAVLLLCAGFLIYSSPPPLCAAENILTDDMKGKSGSNVRLDEGVVDTPYGGIGRYGNLLTYSEAFNDSSWTKDAGITLVTTDDASILAPDGTATAEKLTFTGGSGHLHKDSILTGANTASKTFTFSIWLKAGSGTLSEAILVRRSDGSDGALQNVTLTTSWQRFSVTRTFDATTTSGLRVDVRDLASGTVYCWGAQVEEASTHGVYIKTTSTVITASRGIVANANLVQGGNLTLGGNLYVNGSGPHYFSNGSVGIGTTEPNAKLDVAVGSFDSGIYFTGNRVRISPNADGWVGKIVSNGTTWMAYQTNLRLETSNSGHIQLMPAGNVGIGTAVPGAKLDVYGNQNISNSGVLTFSTSTGYNAINMNNDNIINANLFTFNDPGASEGLSWTGSAWSIDVSPLDRSNADGNLNLYGTANNIALWRPALWVYNAANYTTATAQSNGGLNFTTTGTGHVTFNPGGNVGIGTTSAGFKLDVQTGDINTSGNLRIGGTTTIDSSRNFTANSISSGRITVSDNWPSLRVNTAAGNGAVLLGRTHAEGGEILFIDSSNNNAGWIQGTSGTTIRFVDPGWNWTTFSVDNNGNGYFRGNVGIGTSAASRIHAVTTLNAATGDEIAYRLDYTTNKATSGNDTGLLIKMTDTLSPGTSNLLDLQVGTTSQFNVDNAGNVYIKGNLTTQGTQIITNTVTLDIANNKLVLNTNQAGTPTQDATIEVERGTSSNSYIKWNETTDKWTMYNGAAAYDMGTVTSVALSAPPEFTVSGSPVTTTGTLTLTKANQNANIVYSGPSSGGAAAPTFRALVDNDIPDVITINNGLLYAPTSGNVGIGTTSPSVSLHVFGSAASATGHHGPIYVMDTEAMAVGTGGGITLLGKYDVGGSTAGSAVIKAAKSNATSGNYDYDLWFGTRVNGGNITEKMRILANGYVGIGTTAPNAKLDVWSTVNASPTTGTITLIHPTNYQRSSIVFPSRVNWTSDYGFIEYRDDDNDTGEAAQLTIGTSNDGDDDVVIDPSGRLTIAATNATLDTSGNLGVSGVVTASGGNSGNWNTAYGWGNHALAGYDTTNDSWTGTGNVYTTSGNVGIGTTAPVVKLHVGAKVSDDNSFSYDSNSAMIVHQTPTATATLNDPKTVLMLARQGTGGQAYGAAATFNLSRYENVSTNSRTRLDISLANASFDPTSNNVMTLLSNGNVGLGTTNPGYILQISQGGAPIYGPTLHLKSTEATGNTFSALRFTVDNGGLENDTFRLYATDAGDFTMGEGNGSGGFNNRLWFRRGVDGGHIVLQPSGNVGIGATGPNDKLEIAGNLRLYTNSSPYFRIFNSAVSTTNPQLEINGNVFSSPAYGAIRVTSGLEPEGYFRASGSGPHYFSNGNVGIGTTNPGSYKLYVNGDEYIYGNLRLRDDYSILGIDKIVGYNDIRFSVDNSGAAIKGRWDSTGLRIGDDGTASDTLDVNGTADISGAITTSVIPNLGPNSSNPEKGRWNPLWSAISAGKSLYDDEEFASGTNSVSVYNNSGGTGVVITRVADAGAPNASGYVLQITNDGVGATSPNYGGFVQAINSRRNATFVQKFRAKLDSGRYLNINENSQGTNSTSYWLTSNAGTGKWEEYIRVSHCGNTGSFSSGGHVSVSGGSNAFTWYLASCNVYEVEYPIAKQFPKVDGTNASGTWPISITGNADTTDNYHAGNASGNIPISNGTVNTNLNADMLDGYHYNNLPYLTGNQTITLSGAVSGSGTTSIGTSLNNNASYPVTAAVGNGLKFWGGSDIYKISMGNTAEYFYGPVTDYSIKTVIDGNVTYPGRGFTWGQNAVTPVAALNAYTGNFQTAGNIVSMGNVGIGTTVPGAKLHVYNTGAMIDTSGTSSNARTLTIKEGGDSQLDFGNYPGSWTSALQIQNNDNSNMIWISPLDSANNARIRTGATGLDFYVGGTVTDTGTHSMTLKSDGNVGIRTTNPGTALHVNGTLALGAGNARFVEAGRRSKNSSNVDIETAYGFVSNTTNFLEIRGFAPLAMYRTTEDRPAPYGIGFGNGSESGGIMPIGSGDNLQEIMFYGANSGPTTFTWKRQIWEAAAFDPSNSNYYSAAAMSLNANTGNLTVTGTVTAPTFSGALSGNATSATQATNATNVNGGTVTATTGSFSGDVSVSTGNSTGGGINLADDGDIVDLNDGWATHRFSYGLRITNANSGGSTVIQLANGGSGYTYFNAGNVGIGTTVPGQKLHVAGAIFTPSGAGYGIGVGNNDFTNYDLDIAGAARISSAGNVNFNQSSGSATFSGQVNFPGSGVWQTSGNVGIGTTGPGAKLDVASGDIRTSSIQHRYDYVGTTFSSGKRRVYFLVNGYAESPAHYWKIATLRVTSDGYVGGTLSGAVFSGASDRGGKKAEFSLYSVKGPGSNLSNYLYETGAGSDIVYKVRANAGGAFLDYVDVYVMGGWYVTKYGWLDIDAVSCSIDVWSSGYDAGTAAPAGTDIAKNDTYYIMAGSVGIGNTSPGATLDVTGSIRASGNITSTGGGIGGWSTGAGKVYVTSTSDNVGIGTTAANSKLEIQDAGISGWKSLILAKSNNSSAKVDIGLSSNEGAINLYNSSGNVGIQLQPHSSQSSYFNGGNVGIGTTGPGEKLHVVGDVSMVSDSDVTTALGSGIIYTQNIGGTVGLHIDTNEIQTVGDALYFQNDNAQATHINNLIHVTTAGNVGIGTTGPGYKLEVTSDISAPIFRDRDNPTTYYVDPSGTSQLNTIGGHTVSGTLNMGNQAITGVYSIEQFTSSNWKLDNTGKAYFAGNVGIGTTTPGAALAFANSLGDKIFLYNGASYDRYGLAIQSNELRNFTGNLATNSFTWGYLNNATGAFNEWARMTSGYLGIGTTVPATKLDVNGVITATSGNSGQWNTAYTHSQSATGAEHGATSAVSANMIVRRDGNGYVFGNYFNSTDDVSAGTVTYLMGKFGDNYYRSATAAKVQSFLGLGSMAYVGSVSLSGVLSGSGTSSISASFNNNASYPVLAADGNGLKFWNGSDSYKISMGNAAEYHYGPVTDYSIKTAIDSNANTRGFTWGQNSVAPIAALNVGNGNFQTAGTITASGGNSGNWNTAYGWGNHALAGYDATNDSWTGTGDVYTTSGNVGIGTAVPGGKLDVAGPGMFFSTQTAAARRIFEIQTGASAVTLNSSFLGASSVVPLAFAIDSSEKMRIATNGTVGIGTTGPLDELHIYKSVDGSIGPTIRLENPNVSVGTAASLDFDLFGSDAIGARVAGIRTNAGNFESALALYTANSGGTLNEWMRITTAGNVGIGTTGPASKLHIEGNISLARSKYIYFGPEGTTGEYFYENPSGTVRLHSGGADVWVAPNNSTSWYTPLKFGVGYTDPGTAQLAVNGNVGIGTTTPYAALSLGQVTGERLSIYDNAVSTARWGIGVAAQDFQFYTAITNGFSFRNNGFNGTTLMKIAGDGNVGIGTTGPGAKLDIYGSIAWQGINVAASANGGTVTEVSGNYPANNTSPYTTGAGSTADWGSSNAIDGDTAVGASTSTWIDANGENGITFIKVTFNKTYIIDRVRLAGRYDAYTADGQPQEFQLDFSDGSVQTFTFPSSYTGMQEYMIRPVATSFIRYTTRSKYSTGNNGLRELEAYTRYTGATNSLAENQFIFYNTAKGSGVQANVGIGTTSPSDGRVVSVQSGNGAFVARSATDAVADGVANVTSLRSTDLNSSHWANARYDAYSHAWGYGGSATANTAMTINGSGSVGIGTTSPVYKLDVGPMGGAQSATTGSLGLIRNNAPADSSPYTQARIIVYGGTSVDTGNWGYFGYGADASMRIVYAKTSSGSPLSFGTSSAMDGTGTYTEKMRLATNGDLTVTGYIYKNGGGFQIDHPLDPANKVLVHSFVESPDMKNLYDGVVILGEDGESTIELPEWFEALNKDFRYQLTPIGKPGMPYVKEEIKDNKFTISGDPGMKVSWQVTGTRKDAFAEKYRIKVEEEKGSRDGLVKKGEYIAKDCFEEKK